MLETFYYVDLKVTSDMKNLLKILQTDLISVTQKHLFYFTFFSFLLVFTILNQKKKR